MDARIGVDPRARQGRGLPPPRRGRARDRGTRVPPGGGSNRSRSRWPSFLGEATRDEDGLAVVGHAECRELGRAPSRAPPAGGRSALPESGSAGGSTTTVTRAPRRARSDRGAPASGKRSASRTAAATSTAYEGGGGRRTTSLVVDRDVDDPRAREQRNTAHSWSQPSTCETSRRCRRINSIECRRR